MRQRLPTMTLALLLTSCGQHETSLSLDQDSLAIRRGLDKSFGDFHYQHEEFLIKSWNGKGYDRRPIIGAWEYTARKDDTCDSIALRFMEEKPTFAPTVTCENVYFPLFSGALEHDAKHKVRDGETVYIVE